MIHLFTPDFVLVDIYCAALQGPYSTSREAAKISSYLAQLYSRPRPTCKGRCQLFPTCKVSSPRLRRHWEQFWQSWSR